MESYLRNQDAKDGLWVVNGKRQVIYVMKTLLPSARSAAATERANRWNR